MLAFSDHSSKIVGYLYNKAIVDPDRLSVSGVILGNCVFGNSYKVVGKFFNNTLYNPQGEIVCRIENFNVNPPAGFNASRCIQEAWTIATQAKDHNCPWIVPTDNWASASVSQLLQ